jgi:hypothetical protein
LCACDASVESECMMSYTITFRPRTPELAEKMLDFCNKHVRPLSKILTDAYDVHGPLPASELSYCQRSGHIGFDYGPGCVEREWCYKLLGWMAVKVGTRRQGLPCYLYDGSKWVIMRPDQYDALGQYRGKSSLLARLFDVSSGMHGTRKKLDAEIKRIDRSWRGEE